MAALALPADAAKPTIDPPGTVIGAQAKEQAIAGLAVARAQEQARRRARNAPAAAARRRALRSRYRGLAAGEAREVMSRTQGAIVSAPGWPKPDLPAGARLQYLGLSDARVLDASGDVQGVVDSSLPLQTRTASGDLAPIDLTLRSSARGFAARTSPVAIDIPRSSDDAVLLGAGPQRLRVTVGAARAVTGHTLGTGVLYANADTDTDLFVKPVLHGLETFTTLRSAASPETTSLTITSDQGSQLVDRGAMAPLAVVRGTETVAHVERPVAWDADHTPVPVETEVDGSTIRLTVRHRSANYAYPIVVDPYVTDTCASLANSGTACDGNDWEDTGSGAGFSSWGFEGPADGRFAPYAGWAYLGTGLYIRNTAYNYFWANEIGDWYYWAPPGVNIYAAIFWKLSQDNFPDNATCLMVGIIQNTGTWASGNPHYNCAQQTLDASDVVCAGTCDRNGGTLDDRVVFAAIAQHSGWNNYWMDHLGGAIVYLNENSAPTFADDVPATWITNSNQPFHIQVNDTGLGLKSISFSSPDNPTWYYNAFSPVTFPCTGGRTNPCPLGYNVALSCNNLRWGTSLIRVVATDVAGNRAQGDYYVTCGDPSRYPTSVQYGGPNQSVDTEPEIAALLSALSGVPDSEATPLWAGLRPDDSDRINGRLAGSPVDQPDPDESDGVTMNEPGSGASAAGVVLFVCSWRGEPFGTSQRPQRPYVSSNNVYAKAGVRCSASGAGRTVNLKVCLQKFTFTNQGVFKFVDIRCDDRTFSGALDVSQYFSVYRPCSGGNATRTYRTMARMTVTNPHAYNPVSVSRRSSVPASLACRAGAA